MIKPSRLGHAVLRVRDLKRSEEFYTQFLGLEVKGRSGASDMFTNPAITATLFNSATASRQLRTNRFVTIVQAGRNTSPKRKRGQSVVTRSFAIRTNCCNTNAVFFT